MKLISILCAFTAIIVACEAVPTPRDTDTGKIVGGENAAIDDYPYQVSVLYYELHTCGGVLFNDNKQVLTAAHCVAGKSNSTISVRAGSSIRNVGGVIQKADIVLIHDKYDPVSLLNDIAIINLVAPFPTTSYIASVETLAPVSPAPGVETEAFVTGWGTTEDGGTPSSILQAVELNVYDNDKCKGFYGNNLIQPSMICAGVEEGGKDACQGDSGGPLVEIDDVTKETTLVGLVSWGYGCGTPNYPGVYTDVAEPAVAAFITANQMP